MVFEVEIFGVIYYFCSEYQSEELKQLVGFVDLKMRDVVIQFVMVDIMKVVIFVVFNIVEEFYCVCSVGGDVVGGVLSELVERVIGLVDEFEGVFVC